MAKLELFGSSSCPYTQEMREWLEWHNREFVEYDVELNSSARDRMRVLAAGSHMIPILVEDGRVVQVGWQGRGCSV